MSGKSRILAIIAITMAFLGGEIFDIYHAYESTNWNIFYNSMNYAGWILACAVVFDKKYPEINIYMTIIVGAFLYKLYYEIIRIGDPFEEYSECVNDPVLGYLLLGWIFGCLILLIGYVKWRR